ncbi:EAL domain-containing protein [Halomonas sp. 707D7]|uniref:bifunctional diguanylate cyclase/phosphodiesterase n=3 Tax=unclassified Halomonas TaxID=2609666 RepID=UPI00209C945C|nr:EAL domain-containing protein [Halomonas sp. 707D7]MCP1312811.1 EAL domain-containing protein [Halomonas sp. 707D7]
MSALSGRSPRDDQASLATSRRRAIGLYGGALLSVASVFCWLSWDQRDKEIETAVARMEARASVMIQWTQGVLGQSEQALFSLSEMIELSGGVDADNAALTHALHHLTRHVASIDELAVLDVAGRVVMASNAAYVGESYRDTELFEGFLQGGLRQAITTLQRSPKNDLFYLYNARRLEDVRGDFTGMAVSRIRPEIFDDALARLSMNEGESITLIDVDQQVIARHSQPDASFQLGQRIELAGNDGSLDDASDHTFEMRSQIDGRERLYHLRRVDDYPVYAVVGLDINSVLEDWRERALALLIILVAMALLGAWGLRHYLNRLTLSRLLQQRIEEREIARAHALERESRLDALVNSLQDLIFVFDEQGRFRYIHALHRHQLLIDPDKALGAHFSDILPDALTRTFTAIFDRVRRQGDVEVVEYTLLLDGGPRHFHATVSPLSDATQAFSGVLSVVRDVTEDKKLQAELRIAAAAFQTHLGIMITDARGTILKTNDTFKRITGYSDAEMIGKNPRMFSSDHHGAAFYRELWRRVNSTGNWEGEIWNKRKNGELFPEWITISAIRDDAGRLSHYVATISDISERKAAEQEIHQLAFYDPLTGLTNRRLFLDRVEAALKELNRYPRYGALMLFDIDHFKEINDTLGYHAGDQLLQSVARRLSRMLRDTDTLARLGGDEFAVLIEGVDSSLAQTHQLAEGIAGKLLASLNEPLRLNGDLVTITVSAGVTMIASDQLSVDDYLQQADMALSQAKASGRQVLRFFNPHMQAQLLARVRLEADLRQAVIFKQWELHYQPQVDAQGELTGVEALLRWHHAEHGLVSPGEFIPLLESSGLITEVGEWILEQACQQLLAWSTHPSLGRLTLSVNISPVQFREAGFVDRVESVFARVQAPLTKLKLEVTESLFVEAPENVRETMLRLKRRGVRFSLDDFGTGYSSLSYLAKLPLDQLKIDQSFVQQVLTSDANAAIVESTIALAESLSLEVIAEGVEMRAQYEWLRAHGCLAYQGYLFGRPVPVAQLEEQALA